MIPDKCKESTTDSNVKVADPKSRSAVFRNGDRDEFVRVRFDGCVVKGSIACDWLVAKKGVGTLAIELKGSDVDRAAEQVMAGLKYAFECEELPKKIAGLIVCTRYPRIDTKIQRIKQRALKEFRSPLHVKENAQGLTFEELLRF